MVGNNHFGFLIYFIFFQGVILESKGSLENSEHVANIVTQSLQLLSDASTDDDPFKRLSFLYTDQAYIIIKSGKNIQVIHKVIDAGQSSM